MLRCIYKYLNFGLSSIGTQCICGLNKDSILGWPSPSSAKMDSSPDMSPTLDSSTTVKSTVLSAQPIGDEQDANF